MSENAFFLLQMLHFFKYGRGRANISATHRLGEFMNENLLSDLYKRAMGYYVTETVTEYDAEERMVKKKKTKKFLPPDASVLKEYLAIAGKNDDLDGLSDGELEALKRKYLEDLAQQDANNE